MSATWQLIYNIHLTNDRSLVVIPTELVIKDAASVKKNILNSFKKIHSLFFKLDSSLMLRQFLHKKSNKMVDNALRDM